MGLCGFKGTAGVLLMAFTGGQSWLTVQTLLHCVAAGNDVYRKNAWVACYQLSSGSKRKGQEGGGRGAAGSRGDGTSGKKRKQQGSEGGTTKKSNK